LIEHEHEVAYICGAISDDPNYPFKFADAQMVLEMLGYQVLIPTMIPAVLTYSEHMAIDLVMVECADVLVKLPDADKSKGAGREQHRAAMHDKRIILYKGIDTEPPRW